jgi:outer membrane autotransporter protein
VGEFSKVESFVDESITRQLYLAKKDGNNSKDTLYLCFVVCFKEEEDVAGGPEVPGVSLVNQGADFVIDRGIAAALHENVRTGRNLFAVVGGGTLRYRTGGGSRTKINSTTAVVGASTTHAVRVGELTAGAFFEHGSGRYDTVTPVDVRGKGDVAYVGGGAFARLDFEGTARGNFYAEATARRGKLDLEFKRSGSAASEGGSAPDEGSVPDKSRPAYGSAHIGLGYALKVDEYSVLSPYVQYLWSRQGSDTTRRGEKLDAIDSRRTRVGATWERHVGESRFRVGAAWEREYAGEPRGDGASSVPSLKGNTGRLELGVTLKPTKSVTVDVDVQGHFGKREGVTGSVKVEYRF